MADPDGDEFPGTADEPIDGTHTGTHGQHGSAGYARPA